MKPGLILGIESSCDETAVAVVDVPGRKALSNAIASQHETHAKYGGVVPELASREHVRNILPVLQRALDEAEVQASDLAGLAVTYGPGLAGSLCIGLSAAKALALGWGLPWIGVNHLEGHLHAAFLEHANLDYPFLGLVVSGGHSSLYAVKGLGDYQCLASTRDDAAGEAFDKVAKLLGLGFPGGPALDKLAAQAPASSGPELPMALMKDGSQDFSYSGLKTATRLKIEREEPKDELAKAVLAQSFQEAAVRPLVKRVLEAAEKTGYTQVVLGGGVAANSYLRAELSRQAAGRQLSVFLGSLPLCVDNAAMIAYVGGLRLARGESSRFDLGVQPSLALQGKL